MCEHLAELERDLKDGGIGRGSEGRFDCCLDKRAAVARYVFEDCVAYEERRGIEAGFVCYHCGEAVMGVHYDRAEAVRAFPA